MIGELPIFVSLLVKLLVLLGLVLYAVFAAVMVRQEHLMAGVLEEDFEPVLRMLTYIHLVAAIALIFFAAILL